MTKEQEFNLKNFLLEGIVNQVKHEYDTEEEFEEIYGPSNTVDDVIDILCNIKCHEDIAYLYCPACIDADPENYQHYLYAFGCELSEIGEKPGEYNEYIVWGYDKDNDAYDEYYRGIEKDKAVQIAEGKAKELEAGALFHVKENGDKEPIDWVEVVNSRAEFVEDYSDLIVWCSYDEERTAEADLEV